MGLFNSQKESKNADVPAELKPYYNDGSRGGLPTWAKWLIRVIAALILIFLITIFVRWVWHEAHTTSKKTAKPATSQSQQAKPAPTPSTSKPAPSTSDSSTNSSATSNSSAQSNTSTAPDQPLSNTGPGATITLFLAVTIAGVLLYQYRLRVALKEYK